MRIDPVGAREYYTNSWAPAELIKYPQTFYPCCPPSQIPKMLAKISTPIVFAPPWTAAFYRKSKTNLSRTDDRCITIPNLGYVDPPTRRSFGAMCTPVGKSKKILYMLHSRGRRRVHRHQCYTTCRGRSCCKKATVPYLPVHPLHFTGGAKTSSP